MLCTATFVHNIMSGASSSSSSVDEEEIYPPIASIEDLPSEDSVRVNSSEDEDSYEIEHHMSLEDRILSVQNGKGGAAVTRRKIKKNTKQSATKDDSTDDENKEPLKKEQKLEKKGKKKKNRNIDRQKHLPKGPIILNSAQEPRVWEAVGCLPK